MTASDPPAGGRTPVEQRRRDAGGRIAAGLAGPLGQLKESPNW